MQPQYPAQFPQAPAPQYPQQPQPGYPAQPAYPQQPAYAPPAPQNYQQPAPQYPPQGYPQPYGQPQYAPPAAPAAPLPTGTLDGYWQQPSSSGGPSWKFQDANRQPIIGKNCAGLVARPVTDADVRAQTNDAGQVQTYKDGRPRFVMVVPMQVQPDQEFPEGQAGWWVKGQARDELSRAMGEAGAPQGAPEAGAFIRVTLVGTRPIPGRMPAYQYRVEYQRPQGAGQPSAPAQQPVQAPQPVQQAQPQQMAPQAAPMQQPYQQPVPPAPIPQPAPQPVPAAAQVAPPGPAPQNFSPEQQALFAKLTSQQTATA